jgi:uncharacterized integral membrane protein
MSFNGGAVTVVWITGIILIIGGVVALGDPPPALVCCGVGRQMEGTMDSSEPRSGQPEEAGRPVVTVAAAETEGETRGARFARRAHRTRLYLYLGAAVTLVVFLIALVIANTGHVKVSWVVGSSSVSLVWLVIFSAVLGLLLGLVLGALFHWRTRAPRR